MDMALMSRPTEFKARLLEDFSGKNDDATRWLLVLQFFFLIVPSCCSFILDVYLLGEVDAFTPIPLIFSFAPHLLFVSSTFPWT